MSDLINPTNNPPYMQQYQSTNDSVQGGSSDGQVKDKTNEIVREVTSLMQHTLTVVNKVEANALAKLQAQDGTIPVLDEVTEDDLLAIQQDLEKLVALLQLDNDEHQSQLAQERLKSLQGVMDKQHLERLEKLAESIAAARKAEQAAAANRVLGWIGAALAILTAVVVTVVTGGAAAAFAWAGAAIAVTQLVLNETGASEKIIDAMADSIAKNNPDMSKEEAKAWASGIYSAMFIVLGLCSAGASIGLSVTGVMRASVDVVSTAARFAMFATQIANTVMGLTSAATGATQAVLNYDAAEASAEVNDVNKFMAILQQLLDENKEELEEILQQIQALFNQLIEIVQSKTETGNTIVENMNQMV